MTDNKRFTLKLGRYYDNDNILQDDDVLNLLNELAEENIELKIIILDLLGDITKLKFVREEYCKGILGLFDDTNDLEKARELIKEYLG